MRRRASCPTSCSTTPRRSEAEEPALGKGSPRGGDPPTNPRLTEKRGLLGERDELLGHARADAGVQTVANKSISVSHIVSCSRLELADEVGGEAKPER